jgi:hypothetical protein
MATPTLPNQITIAELDYDQILTNLVAFMKTDPAFADYDFSGSGLRLLSRVLAYVTFYNAYYLTNTVNEAFLDSAQLRSSVASHARMLGYSIRGTESARVYANVVCQLSDTSAGQITLPKNTQFSLTANANYTYYNVQDEVLLQNVSSYLYEGTDIELVEGRPLSYQFTVDSNDPTQRFIIPNANVDYTTITVKVQASSTSNVTQVFVHEENFLTIGPTDRAFFVQESYNGFPELKFGNGTVGQPLDNANIVIADYYVSRGSDGNNVRGPFTVQTANIAGFVRGATAADGNTAPSSGGSDSEDIDNARFLAPLVYQAQNRCVTAQDYKTIILANYGPNIGAINVFGGEQGDPNDPLGRPVYGKVFIAVKPSVGLFFTDIVKTSIQNDIVIPRSVVGVVPEVIDPDYVYIVVSTSVKYDPKATIRTPLQLQTAIANSIVGYAQNNIEKFDVSFRFSKFVRVVDDTDDAILSSLTRLDLEKRIYPQLNFSNQYVLKYGSAIRLSGNTSAVLEATDHRFTYQNNAGVIQPKCFFYEQTGALHIAYRDTITNLIVVFQKNVGVVDIANGVITISNFAPLSIENNEIDVRIGVIPTVNDFAPRLNQLFTIDPTEIHIQTLNDATATLDQQISFFQGGILP